MDTTVRRVEHLLLQFKTIADNPSETVKRWKSATNRKVVGCVGLHIPEEIISAGGMLPIVLLEKDGPIRHADAHVQNNMCWYIRSIADQALTGDLSFLDSLVILDSCHVIRMIGDSLRISAPQISRIDFLSFPVSLQIAAADKYLSDEMTSFLTRMEEVAGRSITEQDLSDAIRKHNDNRRLLQKLYCVRREKPGLLRAVDVGYIVKASMCMPKEEHSALLSQLLDALQERVPDPLNIGVPIVVSGSLCETCDDILQTLESSGATVVDDDLFVGSRYFSTLVDEEMRPREALSYAYFNQMSPCPTINRPDRSMGDHLAEMTTTAKAAGVVSIIVKYCEPHYYSYLMVHRKLRERLIPDYMVEKERDSASNGQIKTRVQAFLEAIEAGEAR